MTQENELSVYDLEKLRSCNRDDLIGQSAKMIGFANETESRAINAMLTLATVVITFTGPFMPFVQTRQINDIEKTLLFVSWIILFLSVIFGLWQTWLNYSFYKNSFFSLQNRAASYSSAFPEREELEKMSEQSEQIRINSDKESGQIFLVLQAAFLVLGFILVLVSAGLTIF